MRAHTHTICHQYSTFTEVSTFSRVYAYDLDTAHPLPPPSYTSLPPPPPFSPSLISFMVSVDVKHHVYLLTALTNPAVSAFFKSCWHWMLKVHWTQYRFVFHKLHYLSITADYLCAYTALHCLALHASAWLKHCELWVLPFAGYGFIGWADSSAESAFSLS